MLVFPLWSITLAGCPWISPAAHRDNQARLDDGDADTDTDADTDVPTGHTGGPCVEDGDEPNDTLATATAVTLPTARDAASCAADPDWYAAPVGTLEVFAAELACTGDAVLRVYRDGIPWATTPDACRSTTRVGLGAGTYAVEVVPADGGDLRSYTLSLSAEECLVDQDLDGQPSDACPGGLDCDDDNDLVQRGGTDLPGNGVDEDCDGADDLAVRDDTVPPFTPCQPRFANLVAGVPALACGAPDLDPVWHHLTFDTNPGDAVDIYLSPTSAPADLFALYTDRDGRYGLDPGETELDAEEECDVAAYGDCPATCLTATGGTTHLWIAQRDCTGPTDYRVRLEVNGSTPAVTIEADVPGPR